MKVSIKAQRHWPLWGEFTGNRSILHTKGHSNTEKVSIWWRHHVHSILHTTCHQERIKRAHTEKLDAFSQRRISKCTFYRERKGQLIWNKNSPEAVMTDNWTTNFFILETNYNSLFVHKSAFEMYFMQAPLHRVAYECAWGYLLMMSSCGNLGFHA